MAVAATSSIISQPWAARAPEVLGSSPVSNGPARRWASFSGTGLATDIHTIRPGVAPSTTGSRASAQGQAQPCPPRAIRATVSTTVAGPTTSSQATWRPRTSARSTPGTIRVSHNAVPSSP
jgi:hypothetical protein